MSLKKIYNIEALRKKLGCETYEELETKYGYDVSGYFESKFYKDDEDDATVYMNFTDPTGYDYMGT